MLSKWQSVGSETSQGRMLTLGQGPETVVLASPLARGESYLPTARAIARHRHVHLIEMPGSGMSSGVARPWRAKNYADWAATVIDSHRLAESMVIGHSYSALVALVLALDYPNFRSLVVADSPGFGEPTSLNEGIVGAGFDAAADFRLISIAWPHVLGNLIRHGRNSLALVQESLHPVTESLQQISMPVLIAWGGRSRLLKAEAGRRLATMIPAAALYVSTRGTHTWVVSRAGEFADVINWFASNL